MEEYRYYPPEPPQPFALGKRELVFSFLLVVCCLLTANFTLYGGFNLGFSVGLLLCLGLSTGYVLLSGGRPTAYSISLLILCGILATGFSRSDDGFVKCVLFLFLFLGGNLGLGLLSGKARFDPGRFQTLGDSFAVFFGIGFGAMSRALRGLRQCFYGSGKLGQGAGAFLLGLAIVFPILLLVIPLLVSADAAFDGLLAMLPAFSLGELLGTVLAGSLLFLVLFSRNTGLVHSAEAAPVSTERKNGLSPITVGTVLGCVCLVYALYLFSQLAYLGGGFSGLLPEEFTMAQYARRGFFEMALLSCVNISIIALCLAIVRKEKAVPLVLRLLCLFVGLVNLFIVASASAKMFLYIESYGLTRLRLLTQIIMLFLALCTVVVCLWLFLPKLPYMKVIILMALVIGAVVIWADIDNCIAFYNVDSYLSGRLDSIDLHHLGQLGSGAVPHIFRLSQEASEPEVRQLAQSQLANYSFSSGDLRSWNWAAANAARFLK